MNDLTVYGLISTLIMHMCVQAYVEVLHMSADACGGQKMVSDPEAGITDCCVLPKVAAGNQTSVLCKHNKHS